MSATVGALRVDLGLNSAEFQQGMKRAEASVAQFGKTAAVMGKTANDVGAMTGRVMARQAQLGFQLQDLAVQIQGGANPFTALLQQGSQVQAVYSGQGGLGQAFRDLGSMAAGLATKFAPFLAIIGAVTAGLGLLTGAINKTEGETIGFGDVAVATWQLFAEGVYNLVQPAISSIGGWFSDLWATISPAIATTVNGIIGGFVGAFEAVKATWSQLPAALGDLVYQAAQSTVNGVIYLIRSVQEQLNRFFSFVDTNLKNAGLPKTGFGMDLMKYADIGNPFAGAAAGAAGAASTAFAGAQQDYLGGLVGAVGDRARANLAATTEEVEGLGGSAKAANDSVKALAQDGMASLADMGKQVASTISSGFADMFKGLIKGTTNAMDAISQLLGKLGDLFIDQAFNMLFNSGTGGAGGLFAGIGKMFGFANGTPSAPQGWAMVGERGPELVHFGGGERVFPNSALRSSGSGQTVNHFHIDAKGAEIGVEQKIASAIQGFVPGMIKEGAPASVAQRQRQRGGGDYRVG